VLVPLAAAAVLAFGGAVASAAPPGGSISFSVTPPFAVNGALSLVKAAVPGCPVGTAGVVAGGNGGVSVACLTGGVPGGFVVESIPGAPAPSLPGVATGDVNGDGRDDIITIGRIAFGLPGGGHSVQPFSPPPGTGALDAGDVNGDGIADIAFVQWGANTVVVWLGNPGAPGSWSPAAQQSYPVGANPFSVAVGDLDGDGREDIVVANGSSNSVTVYDGAASSPYLVGRQDLATVAGGYPMPDNLALADVDNDGSLDILAVGRAPGAISTFLNNGSGNFGAVIPSFLGNSNWDARALGMGDLDADGNQDAIIAVPWDLSIGPFSAVAILYGDGAGHFGSQQNLVLPGLFNGPVAVVTGDFRGTGAIDFAIANSGSNTVTVVNNPVTRDSTPPVATPTQAPRANANGWNSSDVSVAWNWADEAGGSGIDASSCTTSSLSAGEGTIVLSASCTDNAGNTGHATRTVKVDKTAPSIAGSRSPLANGLGWNNTNVTASFTCVDDAGGSGIDIDTVAGATLSGNGAGQSVTNTGACIDRAGNAAASKTVSGISIDKVDPAITGSRSPLANGLGWNNTDVSASFACADNAGGSGVDIDTVAGATLSGNGAGQSVTNTGACVDKAGNAAAAATVSGISIDKVKPALAPVVSPNPVALNAAASVAANATDGLSGIVSASCSSVDTSAIGPGTVSCTATDGAGNSNTASATYVVTVQASKQSVLSEINAELATISKRDRSELRQAAKQLTESLNPANWIDGNHLHAKKGARVFEDEKEAVQKLRQLLKDRKSDVADATLQRWIDTLVTIDRALAQIAIDESGLTGKRLAEANREMAKAADSLAKDRPGNAIEHFKQAWQKTQKHDGNDDD
jgi:hypothetical protein